MHSCFPRTIIAWNHFDNNTVHSDIHILSALGWAWPGPSADRPTLLMHIPVQCTSARFLDAGDIIMLQKETNRNQILKKEVFLNPLKTACGSPCEQVIKKIEKAVILDLLTAWYAFVSAQLRWMILHDFESSEDGVWLPMWASNQKSFKKQSHLTFSPHGMHLSMHNCTDSYWVTFTL